ncbi:uncharacterized protein J4E88_008438 [Alternaria novae-zelandiae]|uniref:uncharacterized protein n=1 Tax=Alternaria novae-zelandiae TaxID=430562 RepID=UPI0020C21260|nr:uncharacterized protein J4E88_008438 [Alternaria novae-zelandiae]KAI4673971.1 hypothetical protein J4E88_008438 [Alternaria novae-zelandiae]
MQIPKRDSHPADPSEPSFLDRPGEIRNLIYEQLFKRAEPILLHNTDAYHAVEPKRRNYDTDEGFHALTARFETELESRIGAADEFTHDFYLGLPLLLVCRQIYHEAASVFYSDNTFVFSRVLDRHDGRNNPRYDNLDGKAYHQFAYASVWLSNIGSQFGMLKKVHIDVDAMCYHACKHALDDFDALPLLRLLWKNGAKKSPITSACTGRRLDPGCENSFARTEEQKKRYEVQKRQYPRDLVNDFNAIFSSLIGNGQFSLQRFANFDRLIHSVSIHFVERYMRVTFDKEHSHWREFAVDQNGDVVIRQLGSKPRHLLDLPRSVLSKIIQLAALSPEGPILDMDNHTIHGLQLNIWQLSRGSRSDFRIRNMLTHNTNVTMVKTSTKSKTSFKDFHFLRVHCLTRPCCFFVPRWDRSIASFNIALVFETADATSLSMLRINIVGLMKALKDAAKEQVSISISLKSPGEDACEALQSGKIPLPDLERRVFLLLSDVIAGWDVAEDKLPDIWMDGHGKLISATYSASATVLASRVENRHAKLKSVEVQQRGYQFATDLSNNKRDVEGGRRAMWSALRKEYWNDWQDSARKRRVEEDRLDIYVRERDEAIREQSGFDLDEYGERRLGQGGSLRRGI